MAAPRAVDVASSTRRRLYRGCGKQFLQPVLVTRGARRGRRCVELLQHLERMIAIKAMIIEKRHIYGLVTPETWYR